jgi:hypothetical protein
MTVEEHLAHTRQPTIGRIVIYRSRTGTYDLPAIITSTVETLFMENVEKGMIPGLSSPDHVHLTVFSPGPYGPGKKASDAEFKSTSPHGRNENQGGSYTEWDIEHAEVEAGVEPRPGTWRWPTLT